MRSLEVGLRQVIERKTPKEEVLKGTHLFHLMVTHRIRDFDGKLSKREWF